MEGKEGEAVQAASCHIQMVRDFVSIDLETTGLDPKRDRITEIGAIKYEGGLVTDRFHSMINPGRKLSEHIIALTGIRDEDLREAPRIGEVIPRVIEFVGELPILAHSVIFDYSFLKKAAVDAKLVFECRGLDTLKIARKYLDQLEHRNLGYLCRYYGIPLAEAHRAMADAEATARLYFKLEEQFSAQEETLFLPQELHFRVKRDVPALPAQKERLYRLLKEHKIVIDYDVEELTRSEASRITDRILAGQREGL